MFSTRPPRVQEAVCSFGSFTSRTPVDTCAMAVLKMLDSSLPAAAQKK